MFPGWRIFFKTRVFKECTVEDISGPAGLQGDLIPLPLSHMDPGSRTVWGSSCSKPPRWVTPDRENPYGIAMCLPQKGQCQERNNGMRSEEGPKQPRAEKTSVLSS